MQSIDEVDEPCAWSPSSISPLSRLPPRAAFPNRLPSSHCGFAGSGAPTAAQPTHPPTPTQPLKMSINATSGRARLFDVLLNDEQCAAFADARRVCQSRAPALRRFVAVLGSIGFRLLDCFTYLVRHLARRRATGSPRAALAVRGRVVGESWRTRSCSRLAQVEMLWAVVLEQRAHGSREKNCSLSCSPPGSAPERCAQPLPRES